MEEERLARDLRICDEMLGFLFASYIPDLAEEAKNLEIPMGADRKKNRKSLGKGQPRKTENDRY